MSFKYIFNMEDVLQRLASPPIRNRRSFLSNLQFGCTGRELFSYSMFLCRESDICNLCLTFRNSCRRYCNTNPARRHQILQDIYSINGYVVSVNDEEILKAHCDMALHGIYVEPTSAFSYAAYMKYVKIYPALREGITVLPLCGSGLKC